MLFLFEVLGFYLLLGTLVVSAAWFAIARRGFAGLDDSESALLRVFRPKRSGPTRVEPVWINLVNASDAIGIDVKPSPALAGSFAVIVCFGMVASGGARAQVGTGEQVAMGQVLCSPSQVVTFARPADNH